MKIKPEWHLPEHKQAARRTKETVPVIHGLQLQPEWQHLGDDQKYSIITYGCQANERDSETLQGILEAMGYTKASELEEASIILMNTCGIRENAANTVLGQAGALKKLQKENPDLIVGLCGCMAQEEGFVTTLLEKYPWIHLIFGTHNLQDLPAFVQKAKNGEKVVEVYSREGEIYEDLPDHRNSRYKASVNIMYGCDKFCTYCIVPYTRGKQRSRTMEAILEEVRTLKKLGYREITLLGQNVNAWGKDLDEGLTFASLLEETAKTGIERVRFMTSHPWDFTDEMVDIIARYDNIMPSIHLPVQSGDDEILRRMGRRYTRQDYLRLFHKIKEAMPHASISTDIIVGFPSESDEAFENTLKLVRECEFDNAFTFIYSPRPQTPAARMEDPIEMQVKKERLQRLNETWNDLAWKKNQKLVGQIVPVLLNGPSKKNPGIFSGYSDTFKPVNVSGENLEEGMIVNVLIEQAGTFSLNGRAVSSDILYEGENQK